MPNKLKTETEIRERIKELEDELINNTELDMEGAYRLDEKITALKWVLNEK